MKRFVLFVLPLLLLTGSLMANEQPRYSVLQREGNLELRRYEPYIVAELEVRASFEEAGRAAFRSLANYIFGENRPSGRMEMTAPVTQTPKGETIGMTAPVIQNAGSSGVHVVSFVMPSRYTLATLPVPSDDRIHLREVPSAVMAAWTYRGGWSPERYAEEEEALRAAILQLKRTAIGPPMWARYNAPFTPSFLRRNEILVEVRP